MCLYFVAETETQDDKVELYSDRFYDVLMASVGIKRGEHPSECQGDTLYSFLKRCAEYNGLR